MKKRYLFSLLILIFITGDTYAPGQAPVVEPEKFGVVVDVSCENESLKNLIESHIRRELRALHDVVLVDLWGDGYTFELSIAVVEQTYKSGQKTGFLAIATLFMRKVPLRVFQPYLPEKFPGEIITKIVDNEKIPVPLYGGFPELSVTLLHKERIHQYIQSTIADFDIEMLEPGRKKR